MVIEKSSVLFNDPLDGTQKEGWNIPPVNFVEHPAYGTLYKLDYEKRDAGFPMVGDRYWKDYQVELEVLPGSEQGYLGISFHVQPDGSGACNFHFPVGDNGKSEAFQTAGIWGNSFGWKLYPEYQAYALCPAGRWIPIRIDVTREFANLYVHHASKPIITFSDLPFDYGGIQFWALKGWGYIRNLKVTDLSAEKILPGFDNPWEIYNDLDVIRKWQVTSPLESIDDSPGIPDIVSSPAIEWLEVESDKRGVVNLSKLFPDQNTEAVVFARRMISSSNMEERILRFTYTDRLTVWCNGTQVFSGPAKSWSNPERNKYFGGRLVPDEFTVKVNLKPEENVILLRSQVTEPWGWAFWMRID